MITVEKTQLPGVLLIKPSVFDDFRGEYVELYNEELYHRNGIKTKFIQDDISLSSKNVLRGLHGDQDTWKLISCLYGKFYLVVLNYDHGSSDFGCWQSFSLSDRNRWQVLIPPKHGNGHLVLSEQAIFHYKQSTVYRGAEKQFTIAWNDPQFKIWWPINNPILSMRDALVGKN
jgi:dTDP-4-dehydrorhamnose 3,5-epimerase